MIYLCPSCKKPILKEDRRRREPLAARSGAVLLQGARQAPRVRCPCGKLTILVKGSLV